jgi:NADPH:quinone reductase-like Zn-dependent oxidoreductase
MSLRMLDTAAGIGGGVVQLCKASKFPRTIQVTASHQDTTNAHAAFFAQSRRMLQQPSTFGFPGIAVVIPSATPGASNPYPVVNDPAGKATSFETMSFQGWTGELWACADVTGKVQVEVLDAAIAES